MARIHTKPRMINEMRTMELIASICDIASLHTRYKELVAYGWSMYVVSQRCGMCNYQKRYITVPDWALNKDAGYWIYYTAHEMAHISTGKAERDAGYDGHGPIFMAELKRICPKEYWHHELGYMKDSACDAGITLEHAAGAKNVKILNILDLL